MAQSFQMLFYMWEGNKMFCTSQVFSKTLSDAYYPIHRLKSNGRHFCVSMSSSQTLSKLCLEISVYWLLRHFRQPCRISNVEIIAVYANGHNVICTSFQAAEIHSEAVHPGSCQFVRASRCRFALTWRADDLTAPLHPDPSPTLSSTLAWMLHYLCTCI